MLVLDGDSFSGFVAGAGARIVLVGAEHCRPSRRQLQEMDAMYAGPARVAAIDALQHDALRRQLDVRFLPTTLIYRDGVLEKTLQGYQPRAKLEAILLASSRAPAACAA